MAVKNLMWETEAGVWITTVDGDRNKRTLGPYDTKAEAIAAAKMVATQRALHRMEL